MLVLLLLALALPVFTQPAQNASDLSLPGYFRFMVCNGLTNQRQAILEAAMLAKDLGLGLVLPRLVSNGMQDLRTGLKPVIVLDAAEAGGLAFGEVFDEGLFTRVMAEQGVPIVPEAATASLGPLFTYPGGRWLEAAFRASGARSVATGCALFSSVGFAPHLAIKHEAFVHALLAALQPAPRLQALVSRVQAHLARPGQPAYDAMHLRYERDWWPLCEYWRAHPVVSPDPAHCGLWQPKDLVDMLRRDFHLGTRPLYIAIDLAAVEDASLLPLFKASFPAGVHTRDSILGGTPLPRELGAQVDYHVSLGAQVWVGNGYSTFSGFLVLQRQLEERGARMAAAAAAAAAAAGAGAGATALVAAGAPPPPPPPPQRTLWYNGGDLPLSHFLPIVRTRWVFVAGAEAEGSAEEESVRAAVLTAFHRGGVAPTCLYAGTASPFSAWLLGQGVEVLHHTPQQLQERRQQLLASLPPPAAARISAFLAQGLDTPHSQHKLVLLLTLALAPALLGTHHAVVTTPYALFLDRPQTFHLASRLPACLSMVPSVATRHAHPTATVYAHHFAYAGLPCLRHRLPDTAAALLAEVGVEEALQRGAGGSGGDSAVHWTSLYGRVINRSYRGLVTALSPRWNAQHGAPLEPYAIVATGRAGLGPCAGGGEESWEEEEVEVGVEEGEGEAWVHPSVRAYKAAAVGAAVSVAVGEGGGLWGGGPGALAEHWRGGCAAEVAAQSSSMVAERERERVEALAQAAVEREVEAAEAAAAAGAARAAAGRGAVGGVVRQAASGPAVSASYVACAALAFFGVAALSWAGWLQEAEGSAVKEA